MATRSMPDPHDFPSNSHTKPAAPEPERPKVQPVVTGLSTKKKRSFGSRVAEILTGDDARSVGDYVLLDVIIPSTKNLISDALTTAVERFFFGDGRSRGRSGSSYGQYTPYNRMSTGGGQRPPWREDNRREMSPRGRSTHDFREVIIESRQEAGMVLDTLLEMISAYGVTTVADYYEASNVSAEFTDRQWGWSDLSDAQIIRVREGGYVIQVPRPVQLK